MPAGSDDHDKLTLWQRAGRMMIRRKAGKRRGEPLSSADWETVWRLHETGLGGVTARLLGALPSSPRCGICGAPFAGFGAAVLEHVEDACDSDRARILRIGIPDRYVTHGKPSLLRDEVGLNGATVVDRVLAALGERTHA